MMLSYLMILCGFSYLTVPSVGINNMHAIYVSVLEIEQPVGDTNGTIRIKLFTNDLEDAIYNSSQKRITLSNDECDKNQVLIGEYFNTHLQIAVDSQRIKYNYLSCEINDISIWINFSFITTGKWTTMGVEADYLMELFPTQSNVVSVTKGEEKRMFRLTKGSTSEKVSF